MFQSSLGLLLIFKSILLHVTICLLIASIGSYMPKRKINPMITMMPPAIRAPFFPLSG